MAISLFDVLCDNKSSFQIAAVGGSYTQPKYGKPVALDVERKGQPLHLVVTPQSATNDRGETVYQIGVQVHDDTAYKRVAFPEGA